MDHPFSFHEEAHHDILLDWASSPSHNLFGLLESLPAPSMPAAVPPPSAFVEYKVSGGAASSEFFRDVDGGGANIHRRLTRFLRSIAVPVRPGSSDKGAEGSRGFRHMMKERQRRERLSQSYSELHSMLSSRSKGDKISLVQSAGKNLKELQQVREKLCRRNKELELMVSGNMMKAKATSIKVHIKNCSSSIDSMISVLQCLKQTELKAAAVRARFSDQDLSVEVAIETEVAKDEVERAMETALTEVEGHCNISPQERQWCITCNVQNAT